MKRLFTTLILIFTLHPILYAQSTIAVEHEGYSTFYTDFINAMNSAQNGDVIYLPGGTVFNNDYYLSKSVHLVGTGVLLDSSLATGITFFNGSLFIDSTAHTGSIEGIYFNGSLNLGAENSLNNFSIRRCNIGGNIYVMSNCLSIVISECYFNDFNGSQHDFLNSLIEKCVVSGRINSFEGSSTIFTNCVFIYTYSGGGFHVFQSDVKNTTVKNSVFPHDACPMYFSPCSSSCFSGCVFNNNLINNSGLCINSNIIQANNIATTGPIFITNSYRLDPSCLGINAGTDGTDVGIYGTMQPFKDGMLPYNPHIQFKSISSSTDQNGNLPINIKVAAQDH